MFHQGQLAVHGLAILLGRNEAGISNRGKVFLHHAVFFVGNSNFASRVTRSPRIPEEEDDAVGAAVEGVRRLLAGHVARHVQRCLPEGVPEGSPRKAAVGSHEIVLVRVQYIADVNCSFQ